MLDNQLNAIYQGIILKVEFDREPRARLFINRIKRQELAVDQTPCLIHLCSSVQTDYEWHESIEARVIYMEEQVSVCLSANHVELTTQTFRRTTHPPTRPTAHRTRRGK